MRLGVVGTGAATRLVARANATVVIQDRCVKLTCAMVSIVETTAAAQQAPACARLDTRDPIARSLRFRVVPTTAAAVA